MDPELGLQVQVQDPEPCSRHKKCDSRIEFLHSRPQFQIIGSRTLALYLDLRSFNSCPTTSSPLRKCQGIPPRRLRQKFQPNKCLLGLISHPSSHLGVQPVKLPATSHPTLLNLPRPGWGWKLINSGVQVPAPLLLASKLPPMLLEKSGGGETFGIRVGGRGLTGDTVCPEGDRWATLGELSVKGILVGPCVLLWDSKLNPKQERCKKELQEVGG